MIRKEQQPEPQEGDSAMGATACSCEGGRASPPERQGGELKGESQTHAVQGTRCRPGIRAEGLFRALTKGLIPRDLICLILHSGLFRFQGHFSWQQFRAPGGEVLVSRVEKGGQHGNWLRRQGLFLRPSWRVSSKAEVYLLVEPC